MRPDAGYWVAWSKVSGIGAGRLKRIWEYFGDLAVAWDAPASELMRAGLDQRTIAAARTDRAKLDPVAELAKLESSGVDLISLADAQYPALLRVVDGAPAILHVRGTLLAEDEIAVAVVVLLC